MQILDEPFETTPFLYMKYYIEVQGLPYYPKNNKTKVIDLRLIPIEENPKFWWYKKVKSFTLSENKPEHRKRFAMVSAFTKMYATSFPRIIPNIFFEGKEYYDKNKNRMRLQVSTPDYWIVI